MENFIVSARKYRPSTFDTVVGQVAITSTLKNAIRSNHLAQAFLFCGPRGVGKTTCARILAKVINCEKVTAEVEPCNECESCTSFNTSHSLNIYELDAASNNSVDDIRSLTDQVRFAPHSGKYKVYIIDEVHMLSQSAFNAFLKTLEEPPPYAIFILATTEKHKIIPTILSRCQIFDFNRIRVEDIAKHLAHIASKEGIAAEPDALHMIAQKADGALRDALSIFDQIVSFAGNNITYKAVIENLNILDYDYYFEVTMAVLKGDISSAFLIFDEILNYGFDGHNFITGLGEHLRNLLVCYDEATLRLLEVSEGIREKYRIQAQQCPPQFIFQALDVISKCDVQYKAAKNHRLHVELALLKLCEMNLNEEQKKVLSASKKKPETAVKSEMPAVEPEPPAPVATLPAAIPVVKAPVVPEKPVKKEITRASRTISILGNLKKENKPESESPAEIVVEKLPEDPFTTEQLAEAWTEYAGKVNESGRHNLYATLIADKPRLLEKSVIEFSIVNAVQENDLNAERMDLLAFLRKKLNNGSIQLTLVHHTDESAVPLYTPRDKFKRMAEKNPQVNELRKQLDLEIDY